MARVFQVLSPPQKPPTSSAYLPPCEMRRSTVSLWKFPATRCCSAVLWNSVHIGAFLNLSQDHLDFHPTMEDYFLAKARLLPAIRVNAVIEPSFVLTTSGVFACETSLRRLDVTRHSIDHRPRRLHCRSLNSC
ncbi:MAG: Mur ligase family protein [Lawsonella clevelandensis]